MRHFSFGLVLGSMLLSTTVIHAAQFTLSGHDRFGVNAFFNPDAAPSGVGTKQYWNHRLYLKPTILIDDHFSVFTEWKMLEYNRPSATGTLTPANGGSVAGSEEGTKADAGSTESTCISGSCDNHYFGVTRVWLDWTSDWGLLRVGRAPRHWGLGMVYNAGNNVEDDFQSTEDVIQYTLPLGFIQFTAGFGKLFEGDVSTDSDDREDYFALVNYDNPEIELNTGFMYNRALRVAPASGRNNYHLMNVFGTKQWGAVKGGAEFAYVFGGNTNVTTGVSRDSNALGLLATGEFRISRFITNAMFAFASGDENPGAGSARTFTLFSRNVRPALIMYSEDVAGVYGATMNSIKSGPPIGRFKDDGAILFKVGETVLITDRLSTGLDFIYGMLATSGTAVSKQLGFEFDLSTRYKWYDNFSTAFLFGYHVTGNAYKATAASATPEDVWALNIQGVLNF